MAATDSTLKRPADRLLTRFDAAAIGDDTVEDFLEKGFSLVICCRACPRMIAWTPPELSRRFASRLGLRIADLVPRLTCTGEGGCGAQDIAVFPHLYEKAWSW
jgi:hypothetical protein